MILRIGFFDNNRRNHRTTLCILTTILVVFFAILSDSEASPVLPETALRVARNWIYEQTGQFASSGSVVEDNFRTSLPIEFFAVNLQPTGYVIVSGDDVAYPVVFYSEKGGWNDSEMPPQMREMLGFYAEEIRIAINTRAKSTSSEKTKAVWEQLSGSVVYRGSREAVRSVAPLVTATWNQGKYYNQKCPYDSAGPDGHVYVGCVAVAMAQIMHYNKHPSTGSGSHSYYHSDYGTLSANFGATSYNWSSMPNKLTAYDSDVATLLYHVGVSVDMDYSPSGSGAYSNKVDDALKNYFKYPDAVYRSRSSYSTSDWLSMLRTNLNQSIPLYYSGNNGTSGHAFVLDGYQGTDYFHVNWGWGGSYNGYFYLNDLTPGSHNYNYGHEAVFGISGGGAGSDDNYEENDSRTTAYDLSNKENKWLNTIDGYGIQADDDWYKIEVTSGFQHVEIDCQFTDSEGDIDIALYDSSGTKLAYSTSTTDNECIEYDVSSGGTYYIRVYYDNEGNQYNLWWDDLRSDDDYEENDSRTTAYDLSNHERTWLNTISGYGVQADDDWYEIEVTPGYQRVQIDCQFTDSAGDIDIQLYDSSGTKLAYSSSVTDDEWIEYDVSSGGTYYIRVYYDNERNTYNLWWDDINPVFYVNKNDSTCGGKSPCHTSINGAVDAARSGLDSTIYLTSGTYSEELVLNSSKRLTFKGGWNSDFSTQSSGTTFIKSPKVNQGSVKLQEVVIKP